MKQKTQQLSQSWEWPCNCLSVQNFHQNEDAEWGRGEWLCQVPVIIPNLRTQASVCSGRLPLKLNPAFQEDPPSNRKSSSWSSVFFLGSLLSTATEDNTSEQSWTNTYFPSFLSYTYRKVNPSACTCIFFSILNCYCTGQQPATGGEEFINTVHQQCGLWLVI